MSGLSNGSVDNNLPERGHQPVTADLRPTKMSWKVSPDLPDHIPPRQSQISQQSSSVPTSPYQQPRDLPQRARSPSLSREVLNTSPRSSQSEAGHVQPSSRNYQGGCKYEVAQLHFKRRIPYSVGAEPLEAPATPLKERLSEDEDLKMTKDIEELYERLLPTEESERRRADLVTKLDGILNNRWPGYQITVNVFGSTGNMLGTSESDVDICVTTDCKALEHVCNLAELFAKKGMERVVCIANAKVPIVKIWDPQLELACDLNVNQHIALQNTQMIKTYVELDERIRPLAMVIKYWTRKRILNDAGRNFTLSSYTWICMIINFLQTRDPAILPSLQQQPGLSRKEIDKVDVSFAKDVGPLRDFGSKNKESVGQLLFQFFRYYGYELNYETSVVSVRQGKVAEKSGNWLRQQNNRLCVEEPFNTSRNLGNTADDTSFRGVHLELRRAFDLISAADLNGCCEEFVFPKEEQRSSAIPIQRPSQPITVQPSRSSRGNRGGRGGNTFPRGPQPQGRRASSASNRGQPYGRQPPWTLTPQEISLQAEQQRYLLHDHLYQQYQMLQAQEQELRMQLQQQAIVHPGSYPALLYPYRFGQEDMSRNRAGTINHPPMSAPLHQGHFGTGMPYMVANAQTVQGTSTSPPSPLLTTAVPDARRNSRRSSDTFGPAASSLRAHSQPAQRPLRSPIPHHITQVEDALKSASADAASLNRRKPPVDLGIRADVSSPFFANGHPTSAPAYQDPRRISSHASYYLGQSSDLHPQPVTVLTSPINEPQGLNVQKLDQSVVGSDQPLRNGLVVDGQTSPALKAHSTPVVETSSDFVSTGNANALSTRRKPSGPLVIDGSVPIARPAYPTEERNGTMNPEEVRKLEVETPSPKLQRSKKENDVQGPLQNGRALGIPDTKDGGLGIRHGHPSPESTAAVAQATYTDATHVTSRKVQPTIENLRAEERSLAPESRAMTKPDASSMTRSAQVLSPVKEVRTPSPTANRTLGSASSEKVTSSSSKTKLKGKQEKTSPSPPATQLSFAPPLAQNSNGVVTQESSKPVQPSQQQTNGWQTPKRKHKKGAKSTNDISSTNFKGGEFLPADEKMRKGG